MSYAIAIRNLSKKYRRYHPDRPATIQEAVAKGLRRLRTVEVTWGLRDVSFEVGAGRTVGIIGSNGSGKSTLLRLIGGIGKADGGTVDVRGRLGALLDLGAGFHPDLTGRENAILSGVLDGLTRRQVLDRLDAIIAFAEIEDFIDNPVRTYSTGMQMRLAFATAVHADPEILLIDEVLSVGDLAFQRKCLERIAAFKKAGCAIVLVSHEAEVVHRLCDEAVWLNGGRLVVHGPATEVVRGYIRYMGGDTRVLDQPPLDEMPSEAETPAGPADAIALPVEEPEPPELQFVALHLLDPRGEPVRVFKSGRPLRIEIEYLAPAAIQAPFFFVRIMREDGLVCCDFDTESSSFPIERLQGPGRIAVDVERLDLNGGRYLIEAACCGPGWGHVFSPRMILGAFDVPRETASHASILNVPFHWALVARDPSGSRVAPAAETVRTGV